MDADGGAVAPRSLISYAGYSSKRASSYSPPLRRRTRWGHDLDPQPQRLERAIACKREAMGLVQGVLDRASKNPDNDPEPDPEDPNEPAEIMDGEDPEMKKSRCRRGQCAEA